MEMLSACSARALAFVNDCPDNFRSTNLGSRPHRLRLWLFGKLNDVQDEAIFGYLAEPRPWLAYLTPAAQ